MQSSKEFYLLTKKRIARAILKLLEDCKSAAYYAYVSNLQTRQMPKEFVYPHKKKRIARAILKLLDGCKSAAYYAYVSNLQTRQMPKEFVYPHKKSV